MRALLGKDIRDQRCSGELGRSDRITGTEDELVPPVSLAAIGVRELVLVDRDSKAVEVYRPQGAAMSLAGVTSSDAAGVLSLRTVEVTLEHRLAPAALVVSGASGARRFTV